MDVAAGEAVRRLHIDDLDGGQGDQVAQALQSGPDQAGAAVTVVEEAKFRADLMAIGGGPCQQITYLAVDGMPFCLLLGGHPSIDRRA